jgi:hypothetical protein
MMLSPPPIQTPFDHDGMPSVPWLEWSLMAWKVSKKYQGSDTTANRPTNGLEIGDWYYDTTLGKPIWVHAISPVVWHLADGTVA